MSKCRGRVRVQTRGDAAGKPLFYWHGGGGGARRRPLAPPLVAAGYTLLAVDAPVTGPRPRSSPRATRRRTSPGWRPGCSTRWGSRRGRIGFSWGASMGCTPRRAFPRPCGTRPLDGATSRRKTTPTTTPKPTTRTRSRNSPPHGGSRPGSPAEVIGAADGRFTPGSACPPLYPLIRESGICPSCSFMRRSRPNCGRSANGHWTGVHTGLPEARIVPIQTRRTASSRTTREKLVFASCSTGFPRWTSPARPRRGASPCTMVASFS